MKYTVKQLENAGGRYWEKGDKRMYYFNNIYDLIGLELTTYKTGNISSAYLDGERISNSKARKIIGKLTCSRIYFDCTKNMICMQNVPDEWVEIIITKLQKKIESGESHS